MGTDNLVTYSEGLHIGYRRCDALDQTPPYPFGYGLSHATFNLGKATVNKAENGTIRVSVPVTKTGKRGARPRAPGEPVNPAGHADDPRRGQAGPYWAAHIA